MNNRGETIYLDSSIFDSLLSRDSARAEASTKLLDLCSSQSDFIGYLSPFTVFEFIQKGLDSDLREILKIAHEYRIKIIEFAAPNEIDLLATVYLNSKLLSDEFEYEYLHLASASYLNLGYYATWNEGRLINYIFDRNLLIAHRFNGYRPITKMVTPKYFVDHYGNFHTWTNNIKSNIAALNALDKIELNHRTLFVQKSVANITNSLEKASLPNLTKNPARLPTIELTSNKLQFQLNNYADEIKLGKIPLLDLNHNTTTFGMDYHLFRLEVINGVSELKNRLLSLVQNLPILETRDEMDKFNDTNNLDFINWLIPQLKHEIDGGSESINQIEQVTKYGYREIDTQLYYSISTESIKTAKQKALDLALFITGNAWQYYVCFKLTKPWCKLNEGFEYENVSHLIIDKEGKEVWVLLINSIIP